MLLFPCLTVKNLGVTPDCHLTMKTRISNLVSSVNFELRRITSIRHALPTDALTTTTKTTTPAVLRVSEKWTGIAQSVERPTEKPGAILTRARVPGAASFFFLRESTSSADSIMVSDSPHVQSHTSTLCTR